MKGREKGKRGGGDESREDASRGRSEKQRLLSTQRGTSGVHRMAFTHEGISVHIDPMLAFAGGTTVPNNLCLSFRIQ